MKKLWLWFILCLPLLIMAQENNDISGMEKNIDKFLTYFSKDNPGAVVAVIKNGDVVFNKAYGLSNIQTKELLTINKAFNINELSKSFTAVAIMKLIEKKKISLDHNLTDIFKDFPEYGRTIKIRNLLSHTSGLPSYDPDSVSTNKQVYDFLKDQQKALFDAGTKMQYSNSDYAMLASIIAKVSKSTYEDYLSKYIFKKLSMKNTWISVNKSNLPIAETHFKDSGHYEVRKVLNGIYGEQGLYTNSLDYAKWTKALLSYKIIKQESLNQIFSVEKLTVGENNSFYGYGWVVMERIETRYFWHGGMGNGYTNLVLYLPDFNTTVLILTNRNDGYDFLKLAIAIAKEFNPDLKL